MEGGKFGFRVRVARLRVPGLIRGNLFLLFTGKEFYYTKALILLVKRFCVVIFIARKQKKNKFPRVRTVAGVPPSSEYGTYKTVKARIWPWLSG